MKKSINNTIPKSDVPLTPKDFESDQIIRWCPGCGNHMIVNSLKKVFAEIGYKKENYVVVSGIGCSSRLPYYVNSYGFHGIHGRANAIATGVKIANPKLSLWVATGDGDSLAIGGNHFIHVVRRNLDMNIILFNNQIYGLTKGQYSPTSPLGAVTKTSPYGTIEHPFTTGELVLGAQGTFFARSLDILVDLTTNVLFEAAEHDGTSVVEIFQNCVIFNDGAYNEITNKENRDDNVLIVEDGKPMIFGKNKDKGLVLNNFNLEVVTIGENGITEKDILVHDAKTPSPFIHLMLAKMHHPWVFGVIRNTPAPTYDDLMEEQISMVKAKSNIKCVDDLLNSGDTWEIKG